MFYHIQIDYFCSKLQKQVLLSEFNITDIEDMQVRIINPYIYGHSFKFQNVDILLASIHSFKIYESVSALTIATEDATLDGIKQNLIEVTQKLIN